MDVPEATDSRPRSRLADRITAVALLAVGIVVALVGRYAVWVVVGLLTTSSGYRPLCPVGQALITGVPAAAFALLALGAILVIIQWRRHRMVWAVAAATLAVVFLMYGAFAVIAVTLGRQICT